MSRPTPAPRTPDICLPHQNRSRINSCSSLKFGVKSLFASGLVSKTPMSAVPSAHSGPPPRRRISTWPLVAAIVAGFATAGLGLLTAAVPDPTTPPELAVGRRERLKFSSRPSPTLRPPPFWWTVLGAATVVTAATAALPLAAGRSAARRAREARWQTALEAAGDGLWDWEVPTDTLVVSEGWRRMLGDLEPAAPGARRRWEAQVHPEDLAAWRAALDAALGQAGHVFQNEQRLPGPAGGWQWTLIRGLVAERDAAGRPLRLSGTLSDITGRKQSQEALRRSEERLRSHIRSSGDAMLTLHPPGWQVSACNPAALALLGARDEAELRGLGLGEVAPDEQPDGLRSPEKARAMVETALREGSHLFEWTMRRRDGTRFPTTVLLGRGEDTGETFLRATVREVTAQKQAEAALRETARSMTQLFLGAPSASCLTDAATGKFIEVNDRYTELVERPRAALLGRHPSEIGLVQGPADYEQVVVRAAHEGRVDRAEIVLLMPDGRAKTIGFSTSVVELAGRRCALTYAVDLTARKLAETEVRLQTEFVAALNATTLDLLSRRELPDLLRALIERAGILLEAPLSMLLLHEDDALVLRAFTAEMTHLHLGLRPARADAVLSWQALESGQAINIADYSRLPHAPDPLPARLPQAVLFLPILHGARTLGVLVLGRRAPASPFTAAEIGRGEMLARQTALVLHNARLYADALREAEARTLDLVESDRRLALAVETAGLGFWVRDPKTGDLWASPRWRRLFGFTPDEPIARAAVLERVHPEDRELVRPQLGARSAHSGTYEIEFRVLFPGGETRWIASREHVDDGNNEHFMAAGGIAYDITRRRVAELDAARHRSEITHLSRVNTLGELSGSLAHELNQPLAIILSNAQAAQRLLAQDPPDLAEVGAILVDIVAEDHRAGQVIQRLRTLLKQEEVHLLPIRVNELVGEVLRLTRSDLIGRGINVRCELAENLPAVAGDKVQFLQVLLNLILNAADAMERNVPRDRRLTLRTAPAFGAAGETVHLSVADCGCGLPAGDAEGIFRPFFTTKKTGLGLGLGICRTIVGSFQGRLWAEPNPDRGATLHIELPALPASSARPVP